MRDFAIGAGCGLIAGFAILTFVQKAEALDGLGVWLVRTLADLA